MIKGISNLAKFYYIRQGEPLGTGHAALLAKTFVGDEPVLFLLFLFNRSSNSKLRSK